MPHRKKKTFGQHFLHDTSVVEKILNAAQITSGELVLEIGPGEGVLTNALVKAGAKVVAVEADRDLVKPLTERFPETHIVQGSALDTDLFQKINNNSEFAPFSYKLVANLPYNIASRVLRRFLSEQPKPSRMVVMVQKEVAERIVAKPPGMSMLSVACQLYADCSVITHVPPGAFNPPPNVDSSVVQLDVKRQSDNANYENVLKIAKAGFSAKRKQLAKNLDREGVVEKQQARDILREIDLSEKVRAQKLAAEDWVRLTKHIES